MEFVLVSGPFTINPRVSLTSVSRALKSASGFVATASLKRAIACAFDDMADCPVEENFTRFAWTLGHKASLKHVILHR